MTKRIQPLWLARNKKEFSDPNQARKALTQALIVCLLASVANLFGLVYTTHWWPLNFAQHDVLMYANIALYLVFPVFGVLIFKQRQWAASLMLVLTLVQAAIEYGLYDSMPAITGFALLWFVAKANRALTYLHIQAVSD
ncbi:hypothetical protein ACODM8_04880 [Vibrio ostreicida]|uniref:hypothetical protein n=1 Tax=Vibrio ostreicida TaxID=526588 RepID=UPI003B5B44DA